MEPERLEQIRLFANLSAEDRADVATCMREVTVDAGTELTTQGDWAYELFVIETGEAEVRKDGEVVRKLGAGDAFGEIGLMATGTRTASVVATSSMRLAAMFLREYTQLQHRVPDLATSLRQMIAERGAHTGF
jgi:CRP-like cAMP-binding protein